MRSDLNRYLWRLGRGSARSSDAAWIRVLALILASASVSLGVLALVLTVVAANERDARMESILPVPAESEADTAVYYASTIFSLTDPRGAPHGGLAVWIEPNRPDAPLPPGLHQWPEPGQAVVSPELLRDLRGHPQDLFGPIEGVITAKGLETDTERRVYIRPHTDTLDHGAMTPISGFGPGGMPGLWGLPTLNALPMWTLVPLVGGLVLLPGLFALGLGSRIGAEAREKRTRQLQAMGAPRRAIAVLDMAEAWPSLLLGSLFTLAGVVLVGVTGLRVQALDLWIPAPLWRSWWPQMAVALLVAHVVSVGVLLLTRTVGRQWKDHRGVRGRQRAPWLVAAAFPVAVVAAIVIPAWNHTAMMRTLGYHLPVFVVVLTLPAMLAIVLSKVGAQARRLGVKRGAPSAILGGRRLEVLPMRTARLVGALAGIILILGQVQLNASTLSSQYQQAVEARAEYGDVVMTANHATYGQEMVNFLDSLPHDVGSIWTTSTYDETSGVTQHTIAGACEGLGALGLMCEPSQHAPTDPTRQWKALAASVGIHPSDPVEVVPAEDPDLPGLQAQQAQVNLVSTTGADLPVDQIQKASYRLVGSLGLSSVGDQWLGAGTITSQRENWVITWGIAGLIPLSIVATLLLAADALTSARETAPLAALFNRRRWLVGLSAWRIWLPVSLAGTTAALAYLVLPVSVSERSASLTFYTPSITYAWVSALLCTLVGLAVTLASARSITTAARKWRPGHSQARQATHTN